MQYTLVGYVVLNCLTKVLATLSTTPEPEFATSIPRLTITAGRDAVLKCVVDNLGEYKVAWKNVDKQTLLTIHTHVITRNERIGVSHQNFKAWYLHIKNVVPDDSGYYMCQINTQPMKSQVGYLDVVVPPEFVSNTTQRSVSVMENGNVTLSCKATGNPPPTIQWKREDGQSFFVNNELVKEYEDDELVITDVRRTHMAPYICSATNGVPPHISRRIYLDVTFPPLIWIQNQLVGAPEGTDVSLECHTEAHPVSENVWVGDTEPFAEKDDRYQTYFSRNSYKAHMRLTIKSLRLEDYGSYKCVARNELGETEGSITLYRLKIPTQAPQKARTEENTVFVPKKTTVTVTTDQKVETTEVERRENSHLPGRQQKYGDGRATNKAKSSADVKIHFSLLLPVVCFGLLYTIIRSCFR